MTMLLLLSVGVAVLAIALVIALILLLRPKRETDVEEQFEALSDRIIDMGEAHARAQERLERNVRGQGTETSRASRTQAGTPLARFPRTPAPPLPRQASPPNT